MPIDASATLSGLLRLFCAAGPSLQPISGVLSQPLRVKPGYNCSKKIVLRLTFNIISTATLGPPPPRLEYCSEK